ncbi:MAG: hypothetical protein ACRDL8_09675 [Solirubrobacteraceae bacterium]
MRDDPPKQRRSPGHEPEDDPDEPGAEGGSESPTKDKLPGMPAKDDPTPLGDTDQHSTG